MDISFNSIQKQLLLAPETRILAEGGIGAGKSLAMIYKIKAICMKYPGSTWLVGRRTFKDLETDTYNICFRNPGVLNGCGKMNWTRNVFDFEAGSRIYFTHFDDPNSLRGPSVSGIYIEEASLVSREVFDTLDGRLRQWGNPDTPGTAGYRYVRKFGTASNFGHRPRHFYYMSTNPQPGSWIKEAFIDQNMPGWKVMKFRTEDNLAILGTEYIENLRKTKGDVWLKRMLDGSWDQMEGRVFTEFRLDRHVLDPPTLEKVAGMRVLVGIDPGIQHYTGVVFCGILPTGGMMVFDEIYQRGLITEEICVLIKAKLKYWGVKNSFNVIDYSANALSRETGNSESDLYYRHGIPVHNADKDRRGGINRMKEALKGGKLFISAGCRNLIQELGCYEWDLRPGKEDTPVKAHDDLIDPLRYCINKEFRGLIQIPLPQVDQDRWTAEVSRRFWEPREEAPKEVETWGLK